MQRRPGTVEERIFSVGHGKTELSGPVEFDWSNGPEGKFDAITSPIFLVGSVRSGTTLLRLMLDHHPELAFCHEFAFSVEMIPESGWPDLADYYDFLETHRIFRDSRFTIDRRLDYPQLMKSFLEQKRDRHDKRLVGATVHLHFDRLLRIWPNARFIHIVRDGRDVARSRVELGWSGNMYTGVQSWIDAERLWEKVRRQIPESRRFELKFEELVTDAEGELTRICDFLDIPFDPAMLRYNQDSTYDPPDPTLIGQWRWKISPSAVRLAEARIAEMLVERGYELSGLERLTVGPILEQWIRIDDRRNRLKARRRLYGTRLFLAEFLMRALEPVYRTLKEFRGDIRERMNNMERLNLK